MNVFICVCLGPRVGPHAVKRRFPRNARRNAKRHARKGVSSLGIGSGILSLCPVMPVHVLVLVLVRFPPGYVG